MMRDTVGLALVHDGPEGDLEETTWHLLHLLDDVGHLDQVALGAIERHLGLAVAGDIRRDPRLQRRDHLRQPLSSADLRRIRPRFP